MLDFFERSMDLKILKFFSAIDFFFLGRRVFGTAFVFVAVFVLDDNEVDDDEVDDDDGGVDDGKVFMVAVDMTVVDVVVADDGGT